MAKTRIRVTFEIDIKHKRLNKVELMRVLSTYAGAIDADLVYAATEETVDNYTRLVPWQAKV